MALRAGFWSTAAGYVGSNLPTWNPSLLGSGLEWKLGLLGITLGVVVDSNDDRLRQNIENITRPYRAVFGKIANDFRNSPLTSWHSLEAAHDIAVARMISTGRISAASPSLDGTNRLDGLRRYLASSNCWDGTPRQDSVALLKNFGPIVVNSSSHNAGIQAALQVMNSRYGLGLHVDGRYWHGLEQVKSLNAGTHADFSIVVDANVFLPQHARMIQDFRFLIPCYSQRHSVVRRRKGLPSDKTKVWYASDTSGEEQTILTPGEEAALDGLEGPRSIEYIRVDVTELITRIKELEFSDEVIAWEPLVTLHGLRSLGFLIEKTKRYSLNTSLYCHKSFASKGGAPIRYAFQDCLIAAWNFARIYDAEQAIKTAFDSDCVSNFQTMRSMTAPEKAVSKRLVGI